MATRPTPATVAYHEAGHAVAAAHLGLLVSVTLTPEDRTLGGACQIRGGVPRDMVIASHAGWASEIIHTRNLWACFRGTSKDRADINDILAAVGVPHVWRPWLALQTGWQTLLFVWSHRRAVDAVAVALLRRKRLTGTQVLQVINRAEGPEAGAK